MKCQCYFVYLVYSFLNKIFLKTCNVKKSNSKGWATYRFSYAMRHNDDRGMEVGGGGAITNDTLKFRKTIAFQYSWFVMDCQFNSWIVNESCTCLIIDEKWSSNIYKISKEILRVSSSCNAIQPIYTGELSEKINLL